MVLISPASTAHPTLSLSLLHCGWNKRSVAANECCNAKNHCNRAGCDDSGPSCISFWCSGKSPKSSFAFQQFLWQLNSSTSKAQHAVKMRFVSSATCEQVAVVKTFQGKFYTLFALRRSNSRKYVKNVQVSSWELVNGVSEGNNCDTITLSCFRAGSL